MTTKSNYKLAMEEMKYRSEFYTPDTYTVYVDGQADVSGNGTPLNPFNTIGQAMDHVKALNHVFTLPKRILVQPGVYKEAIFINPEFRNLTIEGALDLGEARPHYGNEAGLTDLAQVRVESPEGLHALVVTNMTRAAWDQYLQDGGPTYDTSSLPYTYTGPALTGREIQPVRDDLDQFYDYYGGHVLGLRFKNIFFRSTGQDIVDGTARSIAMIAAVPSAEASPAGKAALSGIAFEGCSFSYNGIGTGNIGILCKNIEGASFIDCHDNGNDLSIINNSININIDMSKRQPLVKSASSWRTNFYNLAVINGGDFATEGTPFGMGGDNAGSPFYASPTFSESCYIIGKSFYGHSEDLFGPVFSRRAPSHNDFYLDGDFTLVEQSLESEDVEDKNIQGMNIYAVGDVTISTVKNLKFQNVECNDCTIQDGDITINSLKCTGDLTIDPDSSATLDMGWCDIDGDFIIPATAVSAAVELSHCYVAGDTSITSGSCSVDSGTFVGQGSCTLTNATLELCVGGFVGAVTNTGGTLSKKTLNV